MMRPYRLHAWHIVVTVVLMFACGLGVSLCSRTSVTSHLTLNDLVTPNATWTKSEVERLLGPPVAVELSDKPGHVVLVWRATDDTESRVRDSCAKVTFDGEKMLGRSVVTDHKMKLSAWLWECGQELL